MSETLVLPDGIVPVTEGMRVRDLVVVSIPKMGKGTILGDFTKNNNALVFNLEKGGYDYIAARKMDIYPTQDTDLGEAFKNYINMRNALLANKGKYDYLIIDGLSDLDSLSELGGTYAYMNTTQGKKFNRDDSGEKYKFGDKEFKMVTTLPEGFGYQHSRNWFLDQIEMFRLISPYRIYAAHVMDKMIKEGGKGEVSGAEIALTGKLKTIFSSKVTSMCKLVAEDNKRFLSFDVMNDSIIAGSRAPHLKGRILISEQDEAGTITTYWDNIYNA